MVIRKVLVIDDSTTDLKKLEQIVTDAGYTVITASSGKEALEQERREVGIGHQIPTYGQLARRTPIDLPEAVDLPERTDVGSVQ